MLSNFLYIIAFVWLCGCGLFYNHGYKQCHNFQFTEMQYGSGDSFGLQNFVLRLRREPFTEKLVLNMLVFSSIFS